MRRRGMSFYTREHRKGAGHGGRTVKRGEESGSVSKGVREGERKI